MPSFQISWLAPFWNKISFHRPLYNWASCEFYMHVRLWLFMWLQNWWLTRFSSFLRTITKLVIDVCLFFSHMCYFFFLVACQDKGRMTHTHAVVVLWVPLDLGFICHFSYDFFQLCIYCRNVIPRLLYFAEHFTFAFTNKMFSKICQYEICS